MANSMSFNDPTDPELGLSFFGPDGRPIHPEEAKPINNSVDQIDKDAQMMIKEAKKTGKKAIESTYVFLAGLKGSTQKRTTPYQPVYQKKDKKEWRKKAALTICGAAALASLYVPYKAFSNQNEKLENVREITNEISVAIDNNIRLTGEINPNTQTPYYYYDEYAMADELLKANKYDEDTEIYAAYTRLSSLYNGINALDEIVKRVTGDASFAEYLQKRGFDINDRKSYEKAMQDKITHEYVEKLDVTDEIEGVGR